MSAIPRHDGAGHFWMRCGTASVNRDDSINVYLDVIPQQWRFTLRELDEEDLRKRAAAPPLPPAAAAMPPPPALDNALVLAAP
jgi:hypothetical protein